MQKVLGNKQVSQVPMVTKQESCFWERAGLHISCERVKDLAYPFLKTSQMKGDPLSISLLPLPAVLSSCRVTGAIQLFQSGLCVATVELQWEPQDSGMPGSRDVCEGKLQAWPGWFGFLLEDVQLSGLAHPRCVLWCGQPHYPY